MLPELVAYAKGAFVRLQGMGSAGSAGSAPGWPGPQARACTSVAAHDGALIRVPAENPGSHPWLSSAAPEERRAPGTSADAMLYTFWLCTRTPLLPGKSSCSGLSLLRSRHRPRASRLFVIHVAHVAHRAGRPMSETPSPALSQPAGGNLRGIVAMLAAMFFFSLMDAMLKALSDSYPAMQVAALRGWTALPLVALYVLWRGEEHRLLQVRWLLHLPGGGLTVAMLWLFAYALRELALAEAYTVFFISPLLITALSTWVLRDQVRAAPWAAIALGMVGVLVALRPSQEAFFTLGALAVLASAVCYAVSAIAGRMLTRTDPSSSLVFWTTTMLALGAGLLAWPQWVGVTWTHWPLLAGLAVTGFLGQLAITEAFRHGQVSVVAPFEYTAIAWGVGLDCLLWQAVPGYSTLLGAVIVIGSGLYLVRQERTQAVLPP